MEFPVLYDPSNKIDEENILSSFALKKTQEKERKYVTHIRP